MDLEELRAFIAVVENGSVLGAARALGVSRTTLRRHVDSLEARAGVPLLETARQGVVPTDAGNVLARQGRTMIQEASALLASIREVGHAPSGTLRVVLPVGLPPHLLTPLFAGLHEAHPRLHFHTRFSDNPLSEALTDVDIAVHFGADAPQGPWLSHVIMRVRAWLVAARSYLDRRGTPRTIRDLDRHELFAWQAPGEDARVWRTLAGASFTVDPVLIATDIHFIRSCCLAGLGIGLVPDAILPDPGASADALVPVLPDVVGQERPLRISVPAALAEIPKIKMVIDQVRTLLGRAVSARGGGPRSLGFRLARFFPRPTRKMGAAPRLLVCSRAWSIKSGDFQRRTETMAGESCGVCGGDGRIANSFSGSTATCPGCHGTGRRSEDTGFRDVTKTKPSHFRPTNKAATVEKQQGPTTFEGTQLAKEVNACVSLSNGTKTKLVLEIAEHEGTHGKLTQTFIKKVRKQLRAPGS